MKRLFILLLAVTLIFSCAYAREMKSGALSANPASKAVSFEGRGYDSPEEAAKAYITAFSKKDIPAMLSTFAIETYVENTNRKAQLERVRTFMATNSDVFPNPSGYTNDFLIALRYGELARVIAQQYLKYAWPEDRDPFDYSPVTFAKDEDTASFLNGFDSDWPGTVEFIMFPDLSQLPKYDRFSDTRNLKNLANLAVSRGCEDIREIVAFIRINGKEYAQFFECGKYNDKWYNVTLISNYANVLGIDFASGGLVPYDPSEFADMG